MANIPASSIHTFVQGENVTPAILNQNFQVLVTAINSINQILTDLGIGTTAPMTFANMMTNSLTFNQLQLGYVQSITNPIVTEQANHESRIANLEGASGTTGTVDGGSF